MSRDLEMMAEMMGEDVDQIKRNLTELSPEELEEKAEEHFENLLSGKPRSMFDSRYERGENSTINASTYKQREIAVEQFVDWYADSPHDVLQSQTFRSFLNDMLHNEGYGSETMNTRYWQLVSLFKSDIFKDTIESEIRDVEHMDMINKHREPETGEGDGARPITRDEHRQMLDEAEGNRRLELILECLWQLGLRAKECAELRTSNINWDERKVEVRTAKQKEVQYRTLSFNLKLKNDLKKWIEAERHEYAHGNNDYLFPTHKSDHIYPRNLTKAVKDLAEDAGIQDYNEFHQNGAKRAEITVHSYRKSFGRRRLLDDPDGNLRKVQLLLGHSNTKVTENYLDLDDDDLDYDPESV